MAGLHKWARAPEAFVDGKACSNEASHNLLIHHVAGLCHFFLGDLGVNGGVGLATLPQGGLCCRLRDHDTPHKLVE